MRYFLYARKSTDTEDKQVLSIQSQLTEVREYAKKENLVIVREFQEPKTAKSPGRRYLTKWLNVSRKAKRPALLPVIRIDLRATR